MKIMITGGRDFKDKDRMWKALDYFLKNTTENIIIVHGDAVGADTLSKEWAEERGQEHSPYPIEKAEWDKYGRGAGPRRNHRMLQDNLDVDCILAFPGPKSRGTYDMIERGHIAGVPTKIYK